MPNLKNQTQTQELKDALKNSQAVILADYAGLSVSSQQQLRRLITDAGAKFSVAKNTLLRLALEEQFKNTDEGLPRSVADALRGPTAVLWISDDPIAPTKALVKFAADHDLPAVKLGLLEGKILNAEQVKALAKLPGKQELLGLLVGQLNSPIYSFAQVLRANIQNLVFVINNYSTKQNG